MHKINVNQESCIAALTGAFLNRRSALVAELSVGLAVFSVERSSDMKSRKVLIALYASVGYDCSERSGSDYSMIYKRVSAQSTLFDKIGFKRVFGWINGKENAEAIKAISDNIEKLELYTIQDVLKFCAPRNNVVNMRQDEPKEIPKRRASDKQEPEGTIHFHSDGHLEVKILPDATADELRETANKLFALAAERLKAA